MGPGPGAGGLWGVRVCLAARWRTPGRRGAPRGRAERWTVRRATRAASGRRRERARALLLSGGGQRAERAGLGRRLSSIVLSSIFFGLTCVTRHARSVGFASRVSPRGATMDALRAFLARPCTPASQSAAVALRWRPRLAFFCHCWRPQPAPSRTCGCGPTARLCPSPLRISDGGEAAA
jgi:hypothetical protein